MEFKQWKERKEQAEKARRYLKRLRKERASDREQWQEIGRALYAIDATSLFNDWVRWSKFHQSPFQNLFGYVWKSFRPRTSADQLTPLQLSFPAKRFSATLQFLNRYVTLGKRSTFSLKYYSENDPVYVVPQDTTEPTVAEIQIGAIILCK